jgi:Bacterial SH3 domain
MIRTPGILFALLVVAAVPSAKAGGTVNIKCGPNEDRVWVYESLTDFNVAAKLKCGDPVQIVERVKGYVKIETANGTEGYVLDTSFPKSALPPAPVEKPNDVESAAAAFAARRGVRAPDNSVAAPASTRSSAPASVASAAPSVVAGAASPAVVTPAASSQPAPQTTVTLSAAAAPSEVSEPVRSAPTASPAPVAPSAAAIAKNSAPVSSPGAVAPAVVVVEQPAATKVAYKTPEPAAAPKPAPTPQPAPVSATIAAAPRATPVVVVSAPAPAIATAAKAPAAVPVRTPVAPVSTASVSVPAPAPSDANDTSSMTIETTATSASLQPVADATPPRATIITVKPPAKRPVNPDGDVDSEVDALNTETANCSQYFSAYGLSANQYKWLAQNRQKAFPSVCPAPSPAQVDFVVIFTHDVPFYNATMPDAVHTDVNGFSDWTPLTTVDTAQISASDADKSHHEYVWVFHTNRGAFDPAKFSARRRPLYSKAETNMLGSRGGFRTVMDALTFIEQNATNR